MLRCIDTGYPCDVPNKPKTPIRAIRIESDLWTRALAKAKTEGTTVTAAVREFLTRWVKE